MGTFIASFAATWGPVVWTMIPEVLPLSVRGTAMGVAVFCNWGANFLVSQTFPPLLKGFGPGPVFLGYAVLGILAALFVKTMVTETKGRSLEDIEADLQGGAERRRTAVPTDGRHRSRPLDRPSRSAPSSSGTGFRRAPRRSQ